MHLARFGRARNQPLILTLVIINMIVLAGFAFTLHHQ